MTSDNDITRTTIGSAESASTPGPESGWLSQSGTIDHGRFTPGTVLDSRYRIVGLLGRGGMGEVYRADDLRLGQQVAIKLLPPRLSRDPKRLSQFHNEVRTARQVSHSNVCRVHDIGEVDGQIFITMEFVDGEDLAASIKRVGRFPEDRALTLARQICAGLAAAHERGIIHRDLKPANIMLDKDGRVRLMDFGLAAAGVADDVRAGTPAYMAPEQLNGTGVSAKSDIFALGLVLYEIFTGKKAFNARTIEDLIEQHQMGVITSPTSLVKDLDPAIESALMRCLERNPAQRPGSALVVSGALPGSDPLSAALAAGETPSPEMVAAAGEELAAWPKFVAPAIATSIAIMLLFAAWLCDKTTLLPKMPLEYAPATLADRARDLEKRFGYTTIVDRASGISLRAEVIQWLRRTRRDDQLNKGGDPLSLVSFWYRSSAIAPLVPDGNPVQNTDPVPYQPGMTFISMDPAGRLLAFYHAPTSSEGVGAPMGADGPWDLFFEAAQFDKSRFTPTEPLGALRVYADRRAAWTGSIVGLDGFPIRVEAASTHGRPTLFTVVGPWNQASPTTSSYAGDQSVSLIATIATAFVVPAVMLAAAFAARANVRAGRGDRRGAFRLGAALLIVSMAAWMFWARHFTSMDIEVARFFKATALALFDASIAWLFYLAAEPQVRKVWPHILITWSRLVGGSVRDPRVGRDLVIGVTAGLAMTVISYLFYELPVWLGWGSFGARTPGIDTLVGARPLIATFLSTISNAIQNAMLGVVGLALFKRVIRNEWITFAVATLVFAPLAARGQFQSGIAWMDLLFGALLVLIILGVLFRFGLVCGIAGFVTHFWSFGVPLTLDPSRVYFGASAFALAVILAIAITGFVFMQKSSSHAGIGA